MIRLLEELSMNAWPALRTLLYDGWVLRFAEGYTRRANSVNPLYPSTRDALEKIEACERLYRGQGLAVIFKLTAASQPERLDEMLALRGYAADAPTSVQTLDLGKGAAALDPSVSIDAHLSDEWLAAYCRMGGVDRRREPVLRQMLSGVVPAHGFASVRQGGTLVACGMGVSQEGWVGLFDIVTDPAHRGQGHGTRLVSGLLAWGADNGARNAYLQVMLNNAPALRLYARMGFVERYRYWYRVSS